LKKICLLYHVNIKRDYWSETNIKLIMSYKLYGVNATYSIKNTVLAKSHA
jgi:hypothetical protein